MTTYHHQRGFLLSYKLLAVALTAFLAACGTSQQPRGPAADNPDSNVKAAPSRDGSFTGEIVGKPGPNAKFAGLKIGMQMNEVQSYMGRAPDRWHTYESGKRWIPFYYGNDARRMQVLYRGEGCLIFTDGNIWGGAGGDLIQIEHDATGACYQP